MFPFRIFLCASIFFVASFAYIPSDSAKFNIFDSKLHPFETKLSEHINDYETKFKDKKDEGALLAAIIDVLTNISKRLNGDWKDSFLKIVLAKGGRSINTNVVSVLTVKEQVDRLYKSILMYQMNKSDRRSYGPMIVSHLNGILQTFDDKNSFFRKYPLDSSPLLIEFALLVALFDPITKALEIESEISKYRLPCLAYDLLFEYREYAVDSRLDKLQAVIVRDDETLKIDEKALKNLETQKSEYTFFVKK